MNLIGHYTCAAVPSPEVRAGAVLPDLAALYHRKVRPLALVRAWSGDAAGVPGMEALLAGVAFHHTVDLHFHRAPLFERCTAAIQSALLGASRTPGLKRFLPTHVLCELYLDHLLLRRDPGLAEAFYRDVDGLRELLTTFVARHPHAERAAFDDFLAHIVAAGFVDAYRSHEGILGRMDRILVRFGQRTLEPAERAAVAAWFRAAEAETEPELERFLARMHAHAPPETAGAGAADAQWRLGAAGQWAAGRLSAQFA
jgi:hypothetical protein